MKRILFVTLTAILILSMAACSLPFPLTNPQILFNGEEIETLTMELGQDLTLSANITKDISWRSSDDTVVKATSAGKLFALKEGTVTIALTAAGKTDNITVTVITIPTMWTIGDSIFDFNDNGEDSPIYQLVQGLGYTRSCMDNIAGSTIYNSKGNGNSIVEHIISGLYTDFKTTHGDPELILIFRGTNDIGWHVSDPAQYTMYQIEQSLHSVCQYFSTNYPNTRIVWATPIWRLNIDETIMNEFRQMLHTICPEYGVEVFDLHLEEPFASVNNENYADVLYDGIHPSFVAAIQRKDAFVKYLTGK